MTILFTDLGSQYSQLKDLINARIQTVLNHGQYIMGPEVTELEEALAEFVGVKYAIGVNSGSAALQLALIALKIGPGDEIITTPFTFIATAEAIALVGAKPVFVDIDPHSYHLDPELIAPAISRHTRAIIPVSLYGQCADFDRINAVAQQYGLAVIEDGAQSFGARFNGNYSGALSLIGATSFFPSKPLGCYGDGGACFTNDDALASTLRMLRIHGQDTRYHHAIMGLNGRLDTLQAAILLAKLPTFKQDIVQRIKIAKRYSQLLGDRVRLPNRSNKAPSIYAQYTIEVDERDKVQARLAQLGIPTAVHYPIPLHLQPAFAHLQQDPGSLPYAERAARRVLSLPMHPFLDAATQDIITTAVLQAVSEGR